MNIPIAVDKSNDTPIYKQIMDSIVHSIETENLKYGSKLPTERELSTEIGVSRGTIKKAYEELERNGTIKIIWGSGAYIVKKDDDEGEEDEEYLLKKLIDKFEDDGYTRKEIEAYINLRLRMGKIKTKVNIAAVDCNIEALKIFQKQLSVFAESECFIFLLDEVKGFAHPDEIFKDFDIIFTTTTHFDLLVDIIPENMEKIIKAAVSPDRDTVINILKVTDHRKTGIFAKSRRFREIVGNNLVTYGTKIADKDCIFEKWANPDDFDKFIKDKEALIMPPIYTMDLEPPVYESLIKFSRGGGNIITFNYTIEKGSIIYIEEKISNILYNIKE